MVVSQASRGRGVATAMVAACESRARATGHLEMGIGVGLYADYGAAQRLYVRLGYFPEGGGVTWNNKTAAPGENVRVDDHLVLWLRKPLR
jgi:GNAT superfamily N-acetyltransferase